MSGYRNQRPGSQGRTSSSGPYDQYQRPKSHHGEPAHPSQPTQQQPPQPQPQPANAGSSGSTYKPSSFSSRYQGTPNGNTPQGGQYRRDSDGYRDRERNSRDRYTPRNYHDNGYRRDSYYSSRGGREPPHRNSYSSYGYRDRAERDRAERTSNAPNASYSSYEDRRQRELNSWYPSYQRPGSSSRTDGPRQTGEPDLLDYDSADGRNESPSSSSSQHRAPLPPQSHVVHQQRYSQSPVRNRPSLIPQNFNDDEDDEDEAALEKEISSSIQTKLDSDDLLNGIKDTISRSKPTTTEKPSDTSKVTHKPLDITKNSDIADRIPLSEEHKEELDHGSEESKETTAEPAVVPSGRLEPTPDVVIKLELGSEVKPQMLTVSTKDDDRAEESSDSYDPDSYDPEDFAPRSAKSLVEDSRPAAVTVPSEPLPEKEEEDDDDDDEDEEDEEYEQEPAHDHLKHESSEDVEMKDFVAETVEESAPSTEKKDGQDNKEKNHIAVPMQKSVSTIPPPLKSSEIVPLSTPEACIFPMDRVRQRVWELKNHSSTEKHLRLPYWLKKPISNLTEYPFYQKNFLIHKQGVKPRLLENLSQIKSATFQHKINLLNEYRHRNEDWSNRCADMEAQLKILYPSRYTEDENPKEETEAAPPVQDSRNSRRSRHGDTVRSEAEFIEILKGLEQEKENDPLYRAERLAAKVPDMILNPLEKIGPLINLNNLVRDKEAWAQRIKTDGLDNFTQKEHEAFCEAFLQHPKKFGRISLLMGGLRTAEECVLHYYKTKKLVTDYKQLVQLKKRKGKGKQRGGRRGKGKSSANTPNTETPADSGDELNLDNFIPVTQEELFTESGRRRRAAAPVFAGKKDDGSDERKRSLESNGSDEGKGKKKQRGRAKKVVIAAPGTTTENHDTVPSVQEGLEHHDVHESKSKSVTSSYWSVRDIGIFYHWLSQVGADWELIASKLGSKSATMVKNYYLRNADSHGWKELVADVKRKKKAGLLPDISQIPPAPELPPRHHHHQYPHGQPHQQQQQQPEHQHQHQQPHPIQPAPRNPPLGFFTAPSNVPSNVTYAPQPVPQLPLMPGPQDAQRMPLLPGTGYVKSESSKPVLPPTSNFNYTNGTNGAPAPPLLRSLMSQPSLNESQPSTSRSNPFSITSLLNPPSASALSEQAKPLPSFPITGTFSPTDKHEVFGYRNGPGVVKMLNSPPSNGPTILGPSASTETPSVIAGANTTSSGFNPLDALVAAADQNKDGMNGGPTFPGRSILNPSEDVTAPRSRSDVRDLLND